MSKENITFKVCFPLTSAHLRSYILYNLKMAKGRNVCCKKNNDDFDIIDSKLTLFLLACMFKCQVDEEILYSL